jgi:predicted flap endonuclease-1-like 5' DNA nuclease
MLADDDLKTILKLNELQLLHIDLEAIRADARRLAEETGTVGQIWEGKAPDDFEPLEGIGKVFEQRLYDAGITTYAALAAATLEQLADIVQAKPPAQPDYESWVAQARRLVEEAAEGTAEE